MRDNSDASWERLGKENPYYGVLSYEKYRNARMTSDLKSEFFESGHQYVEQLLVKLRKLFGEDIRRESALDFGCGVGRLVIPLSRYFSRVTGLDVSPSMLDEARQNLQECCIENCTLALSGGDREVVAGTFDFIHSFIVFQHIPVARGEVIIQSLLHRLGRDGILAIHFPIVRNASRLRKFVNSLRKNFSLLGMVINVMTGKPYNEPLMQMNCYDINRVLTLFHEHGISDCRIEIIDNGMFLQAFVYLRNSAN